MSIDYGLERGLRLAFFVFNPCNLLAFDEIC